MFLVQLSFCDLWPWESLLTSAHPQHLLQALNILISGPIHLSNLIPVVLAH